METNVLMESVKFMFLGMGVVFLFLTIMVYAIKLQAKLIGKYFPLPEKKAQEVNKPQNVSSHMAQKVAAITAVIHHEQQKGNE
ncbi:MAG: OadG family protein [Sulfurimonadaceae bacterium]